MKYSFRLLSTGFPTLLVCVFLVNQLSVLAQQSDEDILRPNGRSPSSQGSSSSVEYNRSNKAIPIKLGLEVGANFGMFNQTLTWNDPKRVGFDNIIKSSDGIGTYASLMIDAEILPWLGVQLRGSIDSYSLTSKGTFNLECTEGTTSQFVLTNFEGTENLQYTSFSLYGRFSLNRFQFLVGPTLSTLSTGSYTSKGVYNIIDQNFPTCSFEDPITGIATGERTLTENSTDATGITRSVLAFDFGLAYEIPLTYQWSIVPRVNYRLNVDPIAEDVQTTIVNATNRHLNSLSLGVGLWFNI